MTEPNAKVICDSVSPQDVRLTTIEVVMHRFVLAELNTHRVFSRNSASSRAIPITKTLNRVTSDPAFPIVWACEQPGMQGGNELTGRDLEDAKQLFAHIMVHTTDMIDDYLEEHPEKERRLHKSLLNRLIEPFMWHTVIITSTEWKNFWRLRLSPLAQPEFRIAAEAMRAAFDGSSPVFTPYGEWHMPYINNDDLEWAHDTPDGIDTLGDLKKISVARCARVSALTHDGVRDRNEDIAFYGRLRGADPEHASPFEHVATPLAPPLSDPGVQVGNFRGWRQLRHLEGLG